MKKKLLTVVIAATMVCTMLIGCGQGTSKNDTPAPTKTSDSGKENTDKAKDNIDNGKENTNNAKEDVDIGKKNTDKEKANIDVPKENTNKAKGASNGEKKSTSPAENKHKVIQVPVVIKNGTDVEFAEFYASGASVDDWGRNILGKGVTFGPGEAIQTVFNVDENNLQWDFKAVDNYGDYLEFDGLDFSDCDSSGITVTLRYNRATQTGTITAE